MAHYRLSRDAEEDLERLYEYGILNFGFLAADRYFDDLIAHLEDLAAHPQRFAAVDEIREGYRRSVFGVHSIYYKLPGRDPLLIARILGREDPDRQLE